MGICKSKDGKKEIRQRKGIIDFIRDVMLFDSIQWTEVFHEKD